MNLLRSICSITVLMITLLLPVAARAQQPLPAEGNESQLLVILNSDAELFAKAKACQRLAIIGTPKSVPVVSQLLADPVLSHYARFALEANPSPEVDKAFRAALSELKGRQLVGVINSIATRKDTQSVDALLPLAAGDNLEIAASAISALGVLATPESISAVKQALAQKPSLRVTAADACLTAADRLLIDEKNEAALLLLTTLRKVELPKHINVASRLGEIRTGSQNINALMNSYLQDKDPALFRIGLELGHYLTDTKTTEQLVKQLDTLPPARRILLLHVLGNRGDTSALPAVIKAANSDDDGELFAAVSVLGILGDASVVPVLLQAAVSGEEDLAIIARDSLALLGGQDVDNQLINRLENSDSQERLVLVDVAGRRGIHQAIPLLLKYVSSDDPKLRNSAIDGLGMTVGLNDFPQLLDQMLAMDSTPSATPMKEALLIYVGGQRALAGAQTAAAGDDDATANAATQALGRWLTPDAAPVLLELAKSGNSAYRVRCLRGYIRIIRQFGMRPGQRFQMSKLAFAAASRDEERKLVLDTLTRFPLPQGLKMIIPHLGSSSLSEAASSAAVAIGEKLVNQDPKSVANAMTKVIAVTKNEDIAKRAKVLISRVK